jgi:hypothetical protein
MSAAPLTLPETEPTHAAPRTRLRWPLIVAWVGLIALFAVNLPSFLCLGLDSDILMYDLCARRVLAGDVHYRDLLETNFPGIVWLHMAIRSVVGWQSEALRAVDVAIVAASVWLLTRWLPPGWARVFAATVLFAFYLTTSEWCHCQRDVWMLLPALAALGLRARQGDRLVRSHGGLAARVGRAALEGAMWAAACWIKPFVAVPALAAWLVVARAARSAGLGRLATDFLALVAGGLAVGAAGVGWLVMTGAWPAFYEVMFVWNREYFTYNVLGAESHMGPVWFAVRFFPWVFVHLFAVPIALWSLWRRGPVSPLLAGFYLAWLLQAALLQHLFDYVHVPPIMLGLTVLGAHGLARASEGGGRAVLGYGLIGLVWSGVGVWAPRADAWRECVTRGSTPAVRDRLTLVHRVQWTDLDETADFLRAQNVQDGEVTCFSLPTVALYGELNLAPSTRYLFVHDHLDIFASRRAIILSALVESRQRFVVCDLNRFGMERFREFLDRGEGPPTDYAWADRVVFRAGPYIVYRLDGREMPGWLATHFDR